MKIEIESIIKNHEILLAHKTSTKKETLKEHSENVLKNFYETDKKKNILKRVRKILKDINLRDTKGNIIILKKETIELIERFFVNAIYMHDFGKSNPRVQVEKFENEDVLKYYKGSISGLDDFHAPISSAIYIDTFYKETLKIKNPFERLFSQICLYAFSYVIYEHHGSLENFSEWIEEGNFKNKVKIYTQKDGYSCFLHKKLELDKSPNAILSFVNHRKIRYNGYLFFILIKLLQSSINVSDFVATGQFFNSNYESFNLGLIDNKAEVEEAYNNDKITKGIRDYQMNKGTSALSPINKLRSDMFLEAEEMLLKSLNSNIYLLEMPTGAGKTNTSINLFIQMLKELNLNKCIYVFPFNTLVTQTKEVLDEKLGSSLNFEIINSIEPITLKCDNSGNVDYSKTLLNRQVWGYPGIITSNVSLFNILFSGNREASLAFFQLMDTVLVLDEIQTYNNGIWTEIIEYMYLFNEVMGNKTIIMSATNPHIHTLVKHPDILNTNKVTKLIKDTDKYFLAKEFKNRVIMDKSLKGMKINTKILIEKVVRSIEERNYYLMNDDEYKGNINSKLLIEFIKKKTAQEFKKEIEKELKGRGYLILEIDGDTPTNERDKILDIIKKNQTNNIILISTQVIEAGVDIDMDLGFKDMSLIDSEEQFMGRINRSSNKPYCKAYFFNLDDEKVVYKGDLRLGKSMVQDVYWSMVEDKRFSDYYDEIFKEIDRKNAMLNEDNINVFYTSLKLINTQKIRKRMTLIDSETFQVFVPRIADVDDKKNGLRKVDGDVVWKDFINLVNNDEKLPFAEQEVRKRNIMKDISCFTFSVYGKGIRGIVPVGGIYYLNKSGLLVDDKLDRDFLKLNYSIDK